ncbi:MAG: iron-sulfur cluster assembly scaffold protein [Chloroflexi bacterium]|nr:iron-sulfur cluster assembly scaffold protein [Chloroflexota bacterium]
MRKDHMDATESNFALSEIESLSEKARQVVAQSKNRGSIPNPDAHAKICGCCGDTMQIDLLLSEGKIRSAAFDTDGCAASIACGSVITQLVIGQALTVASQITPQDVIAALDGLPQDHLHCANLVVKTLQIAITEYKEKKTGNNA